MWSRLPGKRADVARQPTLAPAAAAVVAKYQIDLAALSARIEKALVEMFLSRLESTDLLDVPEGTYVISVDDEHARAGLKYHVGLSHELHDEDLRRAFYRSDAVLRGPLDDHTGAVVAADFYRELDRVCIECGLEPLIESLHAWLRGEYADPAMPGAIAVSMVVDESMASVPRLGWNRPRQRNVTGVWWEHEGKVNYGTLSMRADGRLYDADGTPQVRLPDEEVVDLIPEETRLFAVDALEKMHEAARGAGHRDVTSSVRRALAETAGGHFGPNANEAVERQVYLQRMLEMRDSLSAEVFDRAYYVEEIHGDYETWLDDHSYYIKRLAIDPAGREWVEWRAPEWSVEDAEANVRQVQELFCSPELLVQLGEERLRAGPDATTFVTLSVPPATHHVLSERHGALVAHLTAVVENHEGIIKLYRVERGSTVNPC